MKMTVEEAEEWGKTLSFPLVWAALMENRDQINEHSARADERSARADERSAQIDARLAQTDESIRQLTKNVNKMSARVDRVTKNVGGLNRSVGELIETLIAARLWEKFDDYDFKRIYQRLPIYDNANRLRSDIDILLVNTEWCMAVEVKREASERDIDYHLNRMQLIKEFPPLEVKEKKILGAIAGGIVPPDVQEYAFKAGFYVFELTGEPVNLVQVPEGFKPREW
jgi:hypothetical protein